MKCLSVAGHGPCVSHPLGLHWTSPFSDCYISSQISHVFCGGCGHCGGLVEICKKNNLKTKARTLKMCMQICWIRRNHVH